MQVSDEFFQFCSALNQDCMVFYGSDPQNLIYGALGSVHKDRLIVFRDYLNELLASDLPEDQLQEMFHSSYADITFTRGLRDFLGLARDAIDENLQPGAPDRIELARQALLQRLRDAE